VDGLILRDDQFTTGGGYRRLYVQQDANWNVTAITDTNPNTLERFVYDPYGNVTFLNAAGTSAVSDSYNWVYLHQGGRFDNATANYIFRHRDYSPPLGRWAQQEPSGTDYVDGLNLYLDELDDPIVDIDSQGTEGGYTPVGGGNPGSQNHQNYCNRLLKTIQNLQNMINRQEQNLAKNPLGLPTTCPTGKARDSVQGHQNLLQQYKNNLQNRLQEYNQNCGGGGGNPAPVPSPQPLPSPSPSPGPVVPVPGPGPGCGCPSPGPGLDPPVIPDPIFPGGGIGDPIIIE
jgi:RHS repeat-associated protein